ncbi:MAG TPA: hypothetical protein VMT36_06550 [Candidatus Saccharimonadia bacterium]|nr:hypothetical protein [Candidatus Saccharimonadia bacterium]
MIRSTRLWLIIGGVLIVAGAVWIGQGLGIIPGSFMSGDPFWAAAGGVALVVGVVLVVGALRRPRG